LDRVYVPQDALAAQCLRSDALGAAEASPELRAVLQGVARRTAPLVELGCRLPAQVRDFRLCLETAVIARLACKLNALLLERDPLSEPVHFTKPGALAWSSIGVADGLLAFIRPRRVAATPIGGA
ncbi:MAG: squalene synthase HpnC, partial [Roseiarcus sp.]